MFTGLVKDIGKIKQVQRNASGQEMHIQSLLAQTLLPDDSVAINGVCQTVTRILCPDIFVVQSVFATLEKTTLKSLRPNDQVNLEPALTLSTPLGGHLVQGHVNGIGRLIGIQKTGDNYLIKIHYPEQLAPYIVKEGSICLDGVSLTVYEIESNTLTVSIIPHTFHHTTFQYKTANDAINIEVDIIAKYVERLLQARAANAENRENSLNQNNDNQQFYQEFLRSSRFV